MQQEEPQLSTNPLFRAAFIKCTTRNGWFPRCVCNIYKRICKRGTLHTFMQTSRKRL